MKIISYVVTHDHGFAPNPYYGFLTLATCKPRIRSSSNTKVGDILVGTGSVSGIGQHKLIYVGIISEIIDIETYSTDPRFHMKKPRTIKIGQADNTALLGDNIYYKENDSWKQLKGWHDESHKTHDLGGKNVLICQKFWYFGNQAPQIPYELLEIEHLGRPNHKNITNPIIIEQFVQWLENSYPQSGLIGQPSTK